MSIVAKRFQIQYEWDGTPLPETQWVSIEVQLSDTVMCIRVESPFFHNPAPVSLPDPSVGLWKLWEYEVVELFIVGVDGHYTEVEVGPHGHHLVLQLDAPRSIVNHQLPMLWNAQIHGDQWTGQGEVSRALLPAEISRVNAFAIRTINGERQYCCFEPLPDTQPNFHQPERFPRW